MDCVKIYSTWMEYLIYIDVAAKFYGIEVMQKAHHHCLI